MENPIGFVTLLEAVDLMGRAMYGSSWRPFQQLGEEGDPSKDELIEEGYLRLDACDDPGAVCWARRYFIIIYQTDPAIERVIYALAERCESGGIAASYRTSAYPGGLELADLPAANGMRRIGVSILLMEKSKKVCPLKTCPASTPQKAWEKFL
jgi:hypothetical protein